MSSIIKSEKQIELIRESGRILGTVLRKLKTVAEAGITLNELDKLAHDLILKMGGKPVFLGYRPYGARVPYPKTLCASVNDVIVHGVPSDYELKSGDVLKLDLGVNYKGGISDSAITVPIGKVSKEALALIKATRDALNEAIRAATSKNTLGDIGFAVERTLSAKKFHVVDGLTGHGVGIELHED